MDYEPLSTKHSPKVAIDMGRCIYCGTCANACPGGTIAFSTDYRQAVRHKDDLIATEEALRREIYSYGTIDMFHHMHKGINYSVT